MKKIFISTTLLLSFITSSNLYAQNLNAKTDDGRKVVLYPNGTWEFIKKAKQDNLSVITLVGFEKNFLPKNYKLNRYGDAVQLTLYVKNNSTKRVKAWKATLVVNNSFNEELFKIKLNDGTANIAPGETEYANFAWENNQFLKDEIYDQLMAYNDENLKLKLKDIQVIQ